VSWRYGGAFRCIIPLPASQEDTADSCKSCKGLTVVTYAWGSRATVLYGLKQNIALPRHWFLLN